MRQPTTEVTTEEQKRKKRGKMVLIWFVPLIITMSLRKVTQNLLMSDEQLSVSNGARALRVVILMYIYVRDVPSNKKRLSPQVPQLHEKFCSG